MVRGTWVFRNGEMIPKHLADREAHKHKKRVRSRLSAPAIKSDSMDAFKSSISGETFDSKSAWERHVKDNDCVIIGNDAAPSAEKFGGSKKHVASVKDDILSAFHKHENGFTEAAPLPTASSRGIDVSSIAADGYVRAPAVIDAE